MTFEGRVRVDGRFIGRIYSEDMLEIGVGGVLDGEADVARAIVAGTVKGRLRVREELVVEETAYIEGPIDAAVAIVRRGAQIRGEVRITGEQG